MAFSLPPLNFNLASGADARGSFSGQTFDFGSAPWVVQLGGSGAYNASATTTQTKPVIQPANLPTQVDTGANTTGFDTVSGMPAWLPMAVIAIVAVVLLT